MSYYLQETFLTAFLLNRVVHRPPVSNLLYKLTPPEGDTYNGQFIPGGTNIAQSTWSVLRSKTIYGPDADIFRPERWLEAEGEKLQAMKRTAELNFGSGKYGCLGKTIAFLELNKVFAEVFCPCLHARSTAYLIDRCFYASISRLRIRRRGLKVDAQDFSCSLV